MSDVATRGGLTRPRDLVILGAGFSYALSRSSCPLTDQLGEIVRSRLPETARSRMPSSAFRDGRFEEWLSYLSEHQPHFDRIEADEAILLARRVTGMICEVLSEVQTDTLASAPEPWFSELLSVLHALRAEVISLNYDNFVECGAETLGLVIPGWFGHGIVEEEDILNGLPPSAYPGESPPIRSIYDADRSGRVVAVQQPVDTFKLHKLHGSLSWYWLPDGGGNTTLRRWRLPGVFGRLWDPEVDRRRRELPSHDVFIVPPAALKGQLLREPAAREIWRRAADAIRAAPRVVLLGYSVPLADHSVVGMLTDGVLGREVRFDIVNPYPTPVRSRLERLGVPPGAITEIDGHDCIARWSAAEVARLARHAVQKIKSDDRLVGEVLMFSDAPREDRYIHFDLPTEASPVLTLHVVPAGQALVKPTMFSDIRAFLERAATCSIETDGVSRPVIDHWVRERASGAPMTQLHLVTSR